MRRGRALADGKVAHGLYARAIGYSYETTRVVLCKGEPVALQQTVHKPPDVRAAIFWLRNRRPGRSRATLAGRGATKARQAPSRRAVRSPGQDLAQPHRGLGAEREGDAWPIARQAVPDDGGGALGGHQEGHGEGRVRPVMRLATKPGQTTLTPMPSFFST